jgi:hypothetical protein
MVGMAAAMKGFNQPRHQGALRTIADPVPPQFFLRDADGNRFLIVQPD